MSVHKLKRWDSDLLILRDYLNTGYIGYLWQFKNRFGTDDPDEIRRLVKEKDDLERVPRWNSMKIGPKTLKKINNRKTPLPVDFNWDSQFKNAETFEAYNPNCIYMTDPKEASWVGFPLIEGKGKTDCYDLGYDMCDSCGDYYTDEKYAETFEADYYYGLGDYYEEDPDLWEHRDKYKIRHRVRDAILKMPTDKAWEYIIWIDSQDGAISEEENEAWETALANKDLEAALQNLIIERGYINEGWGTGIINELKDHNYYQAEDFEATSYGSYYGACLLPDGSCTETSLDMCRSLGGRFQGPGTSCYPDAGWARPRVMRADSGNQCGYDWKDGSGPCPDPAECTECGRCSECCQDHNGWECEYCDEEGWGDISMHTCPDSWEMQRKWYCSVCNADLKDRILYHNKAGDPDNMANYCQECDSPFCNEHWDGNLPVLCTVCSRVRNFSSESTSSGLGKGFVIGIVAGVVSGLVTTVFGTVISEILLDRLREDPELEITEEDPGTNAPPL